MAPKRRSSQARFIPVGSTSGPLVVHFPLTIKLTTGLIRDMLTDKDADRLNDRQIAHNAGHGFGAAT